MTQWAIGSLETYDSLCQMPDARFPVGLGGPGCEDVSFGYHWEPKVIEIVRYSPLLLLDSQHIWLLPEDNF